MPHEVAREVAEARTIPSGKRAVLRPLVTSGAGLAVADRNDPRAAAEAA